jgi:NAD(P)-dependent dehydrogenase (short-subunit alcohol dehydrogenase family)
VRAHHPHCPTRSSLDTNVCNREVVGQRCDVTDWDSQLALFELGISSFGAIDVVVRHPYAETDELSFTVT